MQVATYHHLLASDPSAPTLKKARQLTRAAILILAETLLNREVM